jgi:thioredoxin reductase (NADPH)
VSTITVYGADWCSDCLRTKRFFTSHGLGFDFVDVEASPAAEAEVRRLQKGERRIPAVVFGDGSHLVEPTHQELGEKLGITARAERDEYDLAVIGGGPAGLTAAIYADRQGFSTLVIDAASFGGQAATTKRIDNYPGFPDGIGGGSLSETFLAHADGENTELLSATTVLGLSSRTDEVALALSNGQTVRAKTVMVATGTTYRSLEVDGEAGLLGRRIHFCSTCDGPAYRGSRRLVVVGGGNSACEEALFLASLVDEVVMLQNLPQLTADIVLRQRVLADPAITVITDTAVTRFSEDEGSVLVDFVHGRDSADDRIRADGVFEFIGLRANSGSFVGALELDAQGYVCTDAGHATSMPRVFAAGDVRSGSTKQLASAAGDAVSCFMGVRDRVLADRERSLETV